MCQDPAKRSDPRAILDLWCTWFLSTKKPDGVVVVPAIARKLHDEIDGFHYWRDDSLVSRVLTQLEAFISEDDEYILGPRNDFNLCMLELFRRNTGAMTEESKIILMNVQRFIDSAIS